MLIFSLILYATVYNYFKERTCMHFIILLALYVFMVRLYSHLRDDGLFLMRLTTKYKDLFWIDNIIISLPFLFYNLWFSALLIVLSWCLSRIPVQFSFRKRKFRKHNFYTKGSLEWIAAFRIYNKYTIPLWGTVFTIACINDDKIIFLIAIAGLMFDNYFFFLNDNKYYIKQHISTKQLIISKLKRLFINTVLPVFILIVAFYLLNTALSFVELLIILAYTNLFFIGALVIKSYFSADCSPIALLVIMSLFYSTFIISVVFPIFSPIIILGILKLSVSAYKKFKNILCTC